MSKVKLLIKDDLISFWLHHLTYIKEQLSISSNFRVHDYVKKNKINHNLVMALKNLELIRLVSRGRYEILKTEKFNNNDSISVIRELKKISKDYQKNAINKKTVPVERSSSEVFIDIIKEKNISLIKTGITDIPSIQILQKALKQKSIVLNEMIQILQIKNEYIEHLQALNTTLLLKQ